MDNEYTLEELGEHLKKINETVFWINKLPYMSFKEFKERIKYHEQEMKRHENEETAWSEDLYEEEKNKRDNILLDKSYICFEHMEKILLDKKNKIK